MEKRTTIINGQPQNIPDTNRVVTWAGLLDYNNMLKNEIPRMGLNNSIAPEAKYSYAFGEGNTLQASASYSFVTGQGNTLKSCNSCIIGYYNEISGDVDNFIIGVGNNTDDGGNFILGYSNDGQGNNYIIGHSNDFLGCDHNFIIGNNNTTAGPVEDALILGRHLIINADEQVWLGCYNDVYVPPSVFFGIGNGDSTRRSNLLYATRKGEFYIPNGVLKTAFTFDDTVSFNGIVECNKQVKLINVDYKEDGSVSFNNSTLKLNTNNSIIKDDLTDVFSSANELIYEKGFLRSIFAPYYQNEALWTVRPGQAYYAINFRPAQDLILQDSDFSLTTPEEIHFYAGKGTFNDDNWAKIKCGEIDTNEQNVHCGTVQATTGIECGNVLISSDQVTTKQLKVQSLSNLYLETFSFNDFTLEHPGNAGIYLVCAEFTYSETTYKTNTGIAIVDNGYDMSRRVVLFSVNDAPGNQTYRVLVFTKPNTAPQIAVQHLHYDDYSGEGVWLDITVSTSKCIFIPLFAKESSQ